MIVLLKNGAEVDARDEKGQTSLHVVALQPSVALPALLLKNGADINARDEDGKTPLHYAAARGARRIVEQLIERGADLQAKDSRGRTPEDIAVAASNEFNVNTIRRLDPAQRLHRHRRSG